MKRFENLKILLAPHSPSTLALKKNLENFSINVIGFIDKNKKDKNIYNIKEIKKISFDNIIIFSPNHFESIYDEYLKYISKDIIYKAEYHLSKYIFKKDIIFNKRKIDILPCNINVKRDKFVFICKSFIGSNNKSFFLYCYKHNINSIILTDNLHQLDELKKLNLPCELLNTKESDYEIAYAKFIIFDQGNYTYLPKLHKEQKTIQLWHGVGLKKMSKLNNIKYDYFISTSHWTNNTNFKNIFLANRFLSCGYPRNDIFMIEEDNVDIILSDKTIYDFVKKKKKEKIILYMPTHREDRTKLPLDFIILNNDLRKLNIYLIVKLHPFMNKLYDKIVFSNILFHNEQGDIYPILKYVDILVSDYSSVVYDFLLLDRPIIFFNYDMDEYIKNVEFLFDYTKYSPGLFVKNQNELLDAIIKKDKFSEKRLKVREMFFDDLNMLASEKILEKILG